MGFTFGDGALCCLCGRVYPISETWIFTSTQESVCDSCAQIFIKTGFFAQDGNESEKSPRSFGISLTSPLSP